jgi:hypothetical protein
MRLLVRGDTTTILVCGRLPKQKRYGARERFGALGMIRRENAGKKSVAQNSFCGNFWSFISKCSFVCSRPHPVVAGRYPEYLVGLGMPSRSELHFLDTLCGFDVRILKRSQARLTFQNVLN